MRKTIYSFLFVAVLSLPVAAKADNTTYDISQSFTSFSVSGTITTDGVIGTVENSDIVDFNITLTQGMSTLNLTSSNAIFIVDVNSYLTATAAGLFYDFDNTDLHGGVHVHLDDSTADYYSNYLCLEGSHHNCSYPDGNVEAIGIGGSGGSIFKPYETAEESMSGLQKIATASGVTPEPSSIVLFGTGLIGLTGTLRRRMSRDAV